MNIVFMGTPDFAVSSLESLIEEGINIKAVVTQPDRPVGRKRIITPPPVKELAIKHRIPVYQPQRVREEEFLKTLTSLEPDLIIVVAYGQILPKSVLELPKIGCINVHASLLPKYRGAAPVQWAIINGESETGVTTMWMDEGLDTGDMFLQESINIDEDWTSEDLFARLSKLGARVLISTIEHIKSGDFIRIPQEDNKSTYAPMLKKEDGEIDWSKNALEIHNLVRGTNPWPGAYTISQGKKIKIWKTRVYSGGQSRPGIFMGVYEDEGFIVGTGDGLLLIQEVQLAGGRKMKALDYLAGHNMIKGEHFADAKL